MPDRAIARWCVRTPVALAVAAALVRPAPARAQAENPGVGRPAQVGAGIDAIGREGGLVLNLRVMFPQNVHWDAEGRVDLPAGDRRTGMFALVFRRRLPRAPDTAWVPFVSIGVAGAFTESPTQGLLVSPPFIVLAGGGIERRIVPSLMLHIDAQVLAIVVPVGWRMGAGLSVPFSTR